MKTLTTLTVLLLIFSCSKDDEDCDCEAVTPNNEKTYYIMDCNRERFEGAINGNFSEKWFAQYERENPCK